MARASYEDDDNKAEARQIERRTEAEQVRDAVRAEHDALIDALPAGSLGRVGAFDPSDNRTWIYSEDPELRAYAKDFLGYDEHSQVGLTTSEKRILKEQSRLEIDGGYVGDSPVNRHYREGITPEAVQRAKKDDRDFAEAARDLWPFALVTYPTMAQNPQLAREALQRLLAATPLPKAELTKLARDPSTRDRLIDMIQDEIEYPSTHSGIKPQNSYDPDENRTAGISTGSYGGGHGGHAQEEQVESIMAGIADWQKRSGFTR